MHSNHQCNFRSSNDQLNHLLPEDMYSYKLQFCWLPDICTNHQVINFISAEYSAWPHTCWGYAQVSLTFQLFCNWASRMITYWLTTCTGIIKSLAPLQLRIQHVHLRAKDMHKHHQSSALLQLSMHHNHLQAGDIHRHIQIISFILADCPAQTLTSWGCA